MVDKKLSGIKSTDILLEELSDTMHAKRMYYNSLKRTIKMVEVQLGVTELSQVEKEIEEGGSKRY
jgi:phosphatidylinositol kinase/protein kinase (PI-3  family)